MDSGEWIGIAAFITGIIGTTIGAIYGARKNNQVAAAEEPDESVVEHKLHRTDRDLVDEFLRLGKRFVDVIEKLPEALDDHAKAMRYLAMNLTPPPPK